MEIYIDEECVEFFGRNRVQKVINLTTNKEFNSIKEAARYYNMKCSSSISRVCLGKSNRAGDINGHI